MKQTQTHKKLISYVLPVFNEEEVVNKFFEVLSTTIKKFHEKYNFEIIFINDGSRDNTFEKLLDLHKKDKRIKILNFSRNFGHQFAITAGIDYAKGDAVVIMDADLQDPPKVSLELIQKWEEGYEIVYAQRRLRKDGVLKKASAAIFYKIISKLSDIDIPRNTGDFRLIDKKVVDTIKKFQEKNRFMRGLFAFVGFKQTAVLFDRDERYAGVTKYPLKKMLNLAIDGITSFSTFPLELVTQTGFLISFISFVGIVYAIFMRIFFPEITVSGWTLMIISILFIGGVQMVMLGILGSYIGRIYKEVQNRPTYIISSIVSEENQS